MTSHENCPDFLFGALWIRKAFHKLSLKYHPDKNPDATAAEKFMLIKKDNGRWEGYTVYCILYVYIYIHSHEHRFFLNDQHYVFEGTP